MQVYLFKDGQQTGPFDENAVLERLRSGELKKDDLGIREGDSNWSNMGDIFAGRIEPPLRPPITVPPPRPTAGFAPPPVPAKTGGGCRVAAGWLLLILGLLICIGGTLGATATYFTFPTPLCDMADGDQRNVDDAMKKYQSAKGTSDETAAAKRAKDEIDSASYANQLCGDERYTRNLIVGGAIAGAVVGLFFVIVGFFLRRVRKALR